MFESQFLFVLIAIFILKPTQQQYQRSVPTCSENGQTFCASCSTAARCILSAGTLKQYNTNCTGTTPMCGPDASDPLKFGCTNTEITDCSCTGTGLTYKSDPYSDQWYILCAGTTETYINCGDGLFYNEAEHNCVNYPPSPTTTTTTTTTTPTPSKCLVSGAGAHDYPETCNTFFVCTSSSADPINGTCQDPTNYFDPTTNECTNPPTRFQCPLNFVGTLGDPFDCRRYYVCFEQELIDVGCCGLTEMFSEQLGSCDATTAPPASCPLSDECAATESTSTTTTTSLSTTTTTSPSTTTTTSPSTTTTTSLSTTTTTSPSTTTTTSPSTTTTTSPSTTTTTSPSTSTTSSSTTTTTSPSTSNSGETTTSSPSTTTSASTSTSTTITTTTSQGPSCTPISSFVCPEPDGFFPQCNYCERTYFRCDSSSATLGTCTGSTVFNTVPTYPSCLSPEYCPYYP